MLTYLVSMMIVSVGFNLLMFMPAYIYKTDKLTDISYALAFAGLATIGYIFVSEKTLASTILYAFVLMWSLRIGAFLFRRIQRMKKDKRFDGMREDFFRFMGFWLLQGVTVFVVLLGALIYWRVESSSIGILSMIGLLIACSGLLVETIADFQKSKFASLPSNKDKWIDSGLWARSRHPNYFGEILVWLGVWMYVASLLTEPVYILLAFVSPLFIAVLLNFVSGVPLLEKSADAKWGKDKKYQDYKKGTPVLVPKIF